MNSYDSGKVIMKNIYGKYVWWEILQTVDYYPKGSRTPVSVANLGVKKNTEVHALLVAANHLTKNLPI